MERHGHMTGMDRHFSSPQFLCQTERCYEFLDRSLSYFFIERSQIQIPAATVYKGLYLEFACIFSIGSLIVLMIKKNVVPILLSLPADYPERPVPYPAEVRSTSAWKREKDVSYNPSSSVRTLLFCYTFVNFFYISCGIFVKKQSLFCHMSGILLY